MPRVLLVLLLLLLLPLAPVRAEDGGPQTLADLERALDALIERLARLGELARRDPRWFQMIEPYANYSAEDFRSSKRPVKARDLLELMADVEAPRALREEAYKLLASEKAKAFDLDLLLERGQSKPRNKFCSARVVKLLDDADADTRQFAHDLLVGYFRQFRNDPAILQYDPIGGTRTQWRKAMNAWGALLRR